MRESVLGFYGIEDEPAEEVEEEGFSNQDKCARTQVLHAEHSMPGVPPWHEALIPSTLCIPIAANYLAAVAPVRQRSCDKLKAHWNKTLTLMNQSPEEAQKLKDSKFGGTVALELIESHGEKMRLRDRIKVLLEGWRDLGSWMKALAVFYQSLYMDIEAQRGVAPPLHQLTRGTGEFAKTDVWFKPSSEKASRVLAGLPTNTQLHAVYCDGEVDDCVTHGAATALAIKFTEGGLHKIDESLKHAQRDLADCVAELGSTLRAQMELYVSELELEYMKRYDLCMSQVLGIASTMVVRRITEAIRGKTELDRMHLKQYLSIGMLIHFANLLSTIGKEHGMIEDMVHVTWRLARVQFEFVGKSMKPNEGEKVHGVKHEGENLVVSVALGAEDHGTLAEVFQSMPTKAAQLTIGRDPTQLRIKVHLWPTMFSQGVDIMQTIAVSTGGSSKLQVLINHEGFSKLQDYRKHYQNFHKRNKSLDEEKIQNIDAILKELAQDLAEPREKNVDILTKTGICARMLGGAQAINCKSGKDRTSMLVTLKAANNLQKRFNLTQQQKQEIMNKMRLHTGVRLRNCELNMGQQRYAFNMFANTFLPPELVPPAGTTGGSTS